MNIQHPSRPASNQKRRKEPHVAGKTHKLDFRGYQGMINRRFMGCAVTTKRPMRDHLRGNAGLLGSFSPGASGSLEITSAISAGKRGSLAASINALRLLPRPLISTAVRRFIQTNLSET